MEQLQDVYGCRFALTNLLAPQFHDVYRFRGEEDLVSVSLYTLRGCENWPGVVAAF